MSSRQSLIQDIIDYQHLIIGSEAFLCLDDTAYQTVEYGSTVSKTSGRENKPGASSPDVDAWNNAGIVDDIVMGEGNKTEITLKKATKGGQKKTVKKIVVDAEDQGTINLSSVPKEVLSIVQGVKITQTGSYVPFKQRIFQGWLKLQSKDEADQLRIGFDFYCSFTVENLTGKADDFAKIALKYTVLDSTKNVVYNTVNQ